MLPTFLVPPKLSSTNKQQQTNNIMSALGVVNVVRRSAVGMARPVAGVATAQTKRMASGGLQFELSDEQRAFDELSKKFAVEKIAPAAPHHDETGEYPWDLVKEAQYVFLFAAFAFPSHNDCSRVPNNTWRLLHVLLHCFVAAVKQWPWAHECPHPRGLRWSWSWGRRVLHHWSV